MCIRVGEESYKGVSGGFEKDTWSDTRSKSFFFAGGGRFVVNASDMITSICMQDYVLKMAGDHLWINESCNYLMEKTLNSYNS